MELALSLIENIAPGFNRGISATSATEHSMQVLLGDYFENKKN